MQEQFVDRILKCADCNADFVFAAGEQLFFFDKQFKNDPKRCKPCKHRRSGLAAVANGLSVPNASAVRTETRTLCSSCGIETTVPFKPTQGRPVLCRQCFGKKPARPAVLPAEMSLSAMQAAALSELSIEPSGIMLSEDAALLAATSMAGARADSSVATGADLASLTWVEGANDHAAAAGSRADMAAQACADHAAAELLAVLGSAPAQA